MESLLNSSDILSSTGPLANIIEDYIAREPQQVMAAAVEQALIKQQILIVEAGTGTGKTFAYLVPALLAGKKVIISTGTKNLQDQLFHRDLPLIKKALKSPAKVALLKGRANYLCRHRLITYAEDGRFTSKQMVADFHKVQTLINQTKQGDIAELTDIAEDSGVWPYVTSTADNCLGQDCTFAAECFVSQARRIAQEADILVINHHLLFADLVLREEGLGELLPGAHGIIIDEAHQLPEIALNFFGISLSSRQLTELTRDIETEYVREGKDMAQLQKIGLRMQKIIQELRLAFGKELQRAAWHEVANKKYVQDAVTELKNELIFLEEVLRPVAVRSKSLESCWKRSLTLAERFSLLTGSPPTGQIHWFETHSQSFALNLTPMMIAEQFQKFMQSQERAWIFTSATLAMGDSFKHFSEHLGLADVECLKLESPFNYAEQALLYVPRGIPDPNHQNYVSAIVEAAVPVIKACGGRTFFLFTSYHALHEAAQLLKNAVDFPLLLQGSMPKQKLIERYRELGNAVLLGTSSFWEGVDVRGEALSCVIIDKLPFAAPDDPILKARVHALKQEGGNPFYKFQLPAAVIALKQGAGRLIRDQQDQGVLMICDPRLIGRPYGKLFLESLPKMQRTRNLHTVEKFFERLFSTSSYDDKDISN